jgi:hypothetical protein
MLIEAPMNSKNHISLLKTMASLKKNKRKKSASFIILYRNFNFFAFF